MVNRQEIVSEVIYEYWNKKPESIFFFLRKARSGDIRSDSCIVGGSWETDSEKNHKVVKKKKLKKIFYLALLFHFANLEKWVHVLCCFSGPQQGAGFAVWPEQQYKDSLQIAYKCFQKSWMKWEHFSYTSMN